jgi:hypothetical protein
VGTEKRRTDRLMLTVPLWVMGAYPKGYPFIEDARTVVLNRDGALVRIFRPLRTGLTVLVFNLITQREGDFRVVGPVAPFSEKGGEYGLEAIDGEDNIWGIRFPSPPEGGPRDPKALLECRECHTVELSRLSLVEVEVLGTAGLISRRCRKCKDDTSWGHPEKKLALEGPPEEAEMFAEAEAAARGVDKRRERRFTLQLPALVRNFDGEEETIKTENSAKSGFCFVSEKSYRVGEGLVVVCPYNPAGENVEVRARIVRRRVIKRARRIVYGVRYDLPPH